MGEARTGPMWYSRFTRSEEPSKFFPWLNCILWWLHGRTIEGKEERDSSTRNLKQNFSCILILLIDLMVCVWWKLEGVLIKTVSWNWGLRLWCFLYYISYSDAFACLSNSLLRHCLLFNDSHVAFFFTFPWSH